MGFFRICLLLLSILPMASSLFLVGEARLGERVSVLCEEGKAFVSFPSGQVRNLPSDSLGQSEFIALEAGPYAVQCGSQVKTMQVKSPANANLQEKASLQGALPLTLSASIIIFFLAGALLIYFALLNGKTEFYKEVSKGKARLFLRAGRHLESVEISDPVFMGCGKPLLLKVGSLKKGQAWEWVYESGRKPALPASLDATIGKEKFSMLSSLYLEDAHAQPAGDAGKNPVPQGNAREASKPRTMRRIKRGSF